MQTQSLSLFHTIPLLSSIYLHWDQTSRSKEASSLLSCPRKSSSVLGKHVPRVVASLWRCCGERQGVNLCVFVSVRMEAHTFLRVCTYIVCVCEFVCCVYVSVCPEAISWSLTHSTNIKTGFKPQEGSQPKQADNINILPVCQSVTLSVSQPFIHRLWATTMWWRLQWVHYL